MRVSVYFNLHRRNFSLRAETGPLAGIVIAHAEHVILNDVTCHVSDRGREMVRANRCKHVHAFIRGTLAGLDHATWTQRAISARIDDPCHPSAPSVTEFSRDGLATGYDPYTERGFSPRPRSKTGIIISGGTNAMLSLEHGIRMLGATLCEKATT